MPNGTVSGKPEARRGAGQIGQALFDLAFFLAIT
jgi:hypothetical protein